MLRGFYPHCPVLPVRCRSVLTRFRHDGRGAAAVEFALVSVMFMTSLLMVVALATVLFLNQQLDFATMVAARQIMNGTVQKNGYGSSDFRTKVVCASLPSVFSCNDVIVVVQSATEARNPGGYYAFVNGDLSGLAVPALSNSTAQYSTGVQGSYEYLQVIYPITFLPSFVTSLFSSQTYNGLPAYLAMSTAAFRNEQY